MTLIQEITILIILTILASTVFYWVTSPCMDKKYPLIEFRIPIRALIRGNTLIALASPNYTDTIEEYDDTLDRIKECESGGDPNICNKQYGCRAGMGLYQLIPSTVEYCEQKLRKEIDPFNPEDNTECATWLYENEGSDHWLPSKGCWYKANLNKGQIKP